MSDTAIAEAFREAAGMCENLAKRVPNNAALLSARDAILALADQPAPDCEPRSRAPELWEIKAHYPGLWVVEEFVEGDDDEPTYILRSGLDKTLGDRSCGARRWRPVTVDLYEAPWPTKDGG